jgi:flagellar hook-associated protein 1 FlgK
MMFTTNILGSLHVARRALIAQQVVLDTVGHNLANATTPGYTRQRAELEAVPSRGGVDVTEIRRLRDRFLDFVALGERQSLGQSAAREGVLQRLQGIFNESPDTNLVATLDRLFDAFQDLSVTPTDPTLRQVALDRGERVAATFRDLRGRVEQLKTDLETEVRQRVDRANELMAQITETHREIIASRGGPAPNDLLDRRDALAGQLGEIVGVMPLDRDDGTVQLAMAGSGVLLVDGTTRAPLSVTKDVSADTLEITAGAAALAVAPHTGALAAVLDLRNSSSAVLKGTLADLDDLAAAVIEQVNRVHSRGSGRAGHTTIEATNAVTSSTVPLDAAGLPFAPSTGAFDVIVHDAVGAVVSTVAVPVVAGVTTLEMVRATIDADPTLTATITGGRLAITAAAGRSFVFANDTSGTLAALGVNTFFAGRSARDIAVADLVGDDPSMIAAARADAGGLVHAGDGANALDLARLRTTRVMDGDTATFAESFAATVGRVGSATRDAIDALDRQRATVELARGLAQQASGVSTDEELVALTQAQTAYAAAARFATTINDIIATLLAMAR